MTPSLILPSFWSLTLEDLKRDYGPSSSYSFTYSKLEIFYRFIKKNHHIFSHEWPCMNPFLSEKTWSLLAGEFTWSLPSIHSFQTSEDHTIKFLLRLSDGEHIESVLIPDEDRLTLCVSSQVGCALRCQFCYTGTQGLKRHLSTEEIMGQYHLLQSWTKHHNPTHPKITNIVFMGQGEPLHNFQSIKKTLEILTENQGIGFSRYKITLSTAGLVPQLKRYHELPAVNLAVSLHASHDDLRSQIMPINKVFPLKDLFSVLDHLPLKPYRRILYEYVLLDGINDTEKDCDRLISLLHPRRSKVNLLRFNHFPSGPFQSSSIEKMHIFSRRLIQHGLVCTIRQSKGSDISAACGQLQTQTLPS